MARLVILERDGVLAADRAGGIRNPGELALLPGAGRALARLNAAGTLTAVVTRQPLLGRGPLDEAMLARLHDHLRDLLAAEGARLDRIGHVGVAPGGPPAPPALAPIRALLQDFRCPPDRAVLVGHCLDDLQAAAAAGVARILVQTGRGRTTQGAGIPRDLLPLRVAGDLAAAVDLILGVGQEDG
ncbi:HAD hydrolase-like protein [Zavarzinia compransoris]|uniref:D,D-heptose 1,7-bisphosphate phosphatase n=1 Tax=Zavarzinia compransoris TaxID=1264899 RepID=A0A317E698_9PROT|nr:HAD hydrolase-like protein [Zavarzinia compransoris]PWR21750.1 D-glycero-beta-D-manno-heptose-1,7-bisphosphate 7-phosphatase [Zavarzinia compransoris]TDP45458.1 D-alpha,beta-D-heptose 1,7-bisphosphate phosphatase [Zavarzinia compransoris]